MFRTAGRDRLVATAQRQDDTTTTTTTTTTQVAL